MTADFAAWVLVTWLWACPLGKVCSDHQDQMIVNYRTQAECLWQGDYWLSRHPTGSYTCGQEHQR